jgi:transposase
MMRMSGEIEANYNETWLFPPSLEELLPAAHPARMVREFIAGQDLKALGIKWKESADGRPGYSARLLLSVWLYGYMTKNRSTRGLERACLDQIGMLWLTGMNTPDHTTLCRFWNANRPGIRKLFKQLLQIAVGLDLIGLVLHAVDGTKILAQASEQEGLHRGSLEKRLKRLDEAIDEIFKQTEQQSAEPGPQYQLPKDLERRQELKAKIQEQLQLLNEKDRDHLNPGDEQARMMKCRDVKRFAYNAQAVVDQQTQLIVAAEVVTDESDNYQLIPMIEQVEENLGKVAEQTAADAGYKTVTGLAEAEEKNFPVLVHLAEPKDQPYHASRFVYDAENNRCICPRGEALEFDFIKKRDKAQPYQVGVYRCRNYQQCPVRWQCSDSKTGRTVQIHQNHDSLIRQREKLKDPAMRALLKQRSTTVEPVFGYIKQAHGFRRWTVRGLEKVQTQWSLLCTAINLVRLHQYWSVQKVSFA